MNLYSRYVHGDGQIARPFGGLRAGGPHHPLADLEDQPALLGDRDELAGRNIAALRMAPAHERLEPGDIAGLDIDLRLVDEAQLVAGTRMAQVVLDHAAVAHRCAHLHLVEAIDAAAVLLGAIERGVGVLHQRLARRRHRSG